MKTIPKVLVALLAMMLMGGLVACGTPEAQPTAVPTAVPTAEPTPLPPQPVTLRYANWNLGTEEENNIQRQIPHQLQAGQVEGSQSFF